MSFAMNKTENDNINSPDSPEGVKRETITPDAPEGKSSWVQIVGFVLFLAVSCFPGIGKAGFFFDYGLDFTILAAMAIVGGGLAELMIDPDHRWPAMVGGAIAAPCGLFGGYHYASLRDSLYKIEIGLVMLVTALPGYGIYLLINKLTGHQPDTDDALTEEAREKEID